MTMTCISFAAFHRLPVAARTAFVFIPRFAQRVTRLLLFLNFLTGLEDATQEPVLGLIH
jgi:hypothetical protein